MRNSPIEMFAVLDTCADNEPVDAIFTQAADAEEYILSICEGWVYELMIASDPFDVMGKIEWDYYADWRYLMRDAASTFFIQKVKIYD